MKRSVCQRKHINRIKILIKELEKLEKTTSDIEFDMARWCVIGELTGEMDSSLDRQRIREEILLATKNPCGTSACLAGKAGLIPRIRRMGFKWDVTKSGEVRGLFRYKTLRGDRAIRKFFGSKVFIDVFLMDAMDAREVDTLPQGIQVLKDFVSDSA